MIFVLRRDPGELSGEEHAQLTKAFPHGYSLQRVDPKDCHQHLALCKAAKPAAVILPQDLPIPALAMQEGVPHISLQGDQLKELLPLKPEFKEFVPH